MQNEAINQAIKEATGINGDFISDLNAMHDAEQCLIQEGGTWFSNYCDYLFKISRYKALMTGGIHTTARQRAEAFLRVKGLWKD